MNGPGSPWVNSHQMTINGKRDGFALEDLMAVADQIHNFRKEASEIMEAVQQSVSRWPEFTEQAGVPDTLTTTIQSNLRVL